jgi:hypothetical protein
LYHFDKLLFVFQFDVIAIHAAGYNEKCKTGHEHDRLVLLLDTVKVDHKHAAEDEADTGLEPIAAHKGGGEIANLGESDYQREVLALLGVQSGVVKSETGKGKDDHTRVILLEMRHPLTDQDINVVKEG